MITPQNIIDISIPIQEGMVVYPGNPEVHIRTIEGKTSYHSVITLGSHTGTHIDAPKHVLKDSATIDKLPLTSFIGTCRVLDMTRVTDSIRVSDFQHVSIHNGDRILLKTKNSFSDHIIFNDAYIYLDGDTANFLAEKNIGLIGIDYLSIKKRGSKDLRPHTSFLERGIPILEGIRLRDVEPGEYTLVALPLAITKGDGSPCRAILF